jgi:hypothetical protein
MALVRAAAAAQRRAELPQRASGAPACDAEGRRCSARPGWSSSAFATLGGGTSGGGGDNDTITGDAGADEIVVACAAALRLEPADVVASLPPGPMMCATPLPRLAQAKSLRRSSLITNW